MLGAAYGLLFSMQIEGFCAGNFAAFGAREGAAAQVLGLVGARQGGASGTQPGLVAGLSLPEQGNALAECRVWVRERHKLRTTR